MRNMLDQQMETRKVQESNEAEREKAIIKQNIERFKISMEKDMKK